MLVSLLYVAIFLNLHRQGDLASTSQTTSPATSVYTKSKNKTRGTTMLTKVKKARESSVRSPVNFDIRTAKTYGKNANDFKGCMKL